MKELEKSVVLLEDRLTELLKQYNFIKEQKESTCSKFGDSFVALASIINDPLIVFDQEENLIFANKKAQLIFDIQPTAKSHNIYSQFIENDSLLHFLDDLTEFVVDGKVDKNSTEILLTFRNDNFYAKNIKVKFSKLNDNGKNYLLLLFNPIKNDFSYSEVVKLSKFDNQLFSDLADLTKKAEQLVGYNAKLKKSSSKLQESNSSKDRLFSIIAHDLKNPFNAILGLTEILKDDSDLTKDDISTIADRIHSSSKRVLALIEDLLDWARLQTNRLEVHHETFDLDDSIYNNIYLQKDSAMKKNIEIEASTSKGLQVYADVNMVKTVIRNLISNAIKFTHNGGKIKISSYVEEGLAKVTVADNGVGISKENIKKILDPREHFTQEGTSKEKGTGLGLVLCREFIELNQGEFFIKSQPNKGSQFSFTLPIVN